MHWKLVDSNGNTVKPGGSLTSFRGDHATFECITKSPGCGSTGKIKTTLGEHYPSVYDCTIVDAHRQDLDRDFFRYPMSPAEQAAHENNMCLCRHTSDCIT